MPDFIFDMPYVVIYAAFFVIGFVRGHATYSIAKYVTEKTVAGTHPKSPTLRRIRDWLDSSSLDNGKKIIHRYGLVAVPVCYLTIGLQTVVLAAAGVVGMTRGKFALAQIPGVAAWAAIYSTVGWAAWEAVITQAVTSWLGIAIAVFVIATVAMIALQRRIKRKARITDETSTDSPVKQPTVVEN